MCLNLHRSEKSTAIKEDSPVSVILSAGSASVRSKKGTFVPKMGTVVPDSFQSEGFVLSYAAAIAAALRRELGDTNGAIKVVMRWTDVSERTAKYWFTGKRGPSGEHLILLASHSSAVFVALLELTGRSQRLGGKWREAREKLKSVMDLMDGDIGAIV